MYRLIAMDIDDTLLNSKLEISDRNRQAIRDAVAKGVIVTLATGRMYRSARPYALSLGLDVPLITDQGAVIRTVQTEQELVHWRIDFETAIDVIDYANQHDIHLNLFIGDNLYVEKDDYWTREYVNRFMVEFTAVGPLREFLRTPPTKLLLIGEPGRIDRIEPEFRSLFATRLTIARSTPNFLSLGHPESSKGRALTFLAAKYGVELAETLAIGDSYNDLDLLETAGLACVVGNARPELKERADYVAASCDEDGVAEIIERFVLL